MQPGKGKGLSSKVSCEERVLRTLGTSYLKGKHMVFRTTELFFFFPQASGFSCLMSIPYGFCEDGD